MAGWGVTQRWLCFLTVWTTLFAALFLGLFTGGARPAKANDTVSISLLALSLDQPPLDVLISNFERAYPNIRVASRMCQPPRFCISSRRPSSRRATLPTC